MRGICELAGAANINSINYYFGGKELLYKEILEIIFAAYEKIKTPEESELLPEQRLRNFIYSYCKMYYEKNEFKADMIAILNAEMIDPSIFFNELIEKYNRPRIKKNLKIVKDFLGPKASDDVVRNCFISIGGQIIYYSYAWPLFSRLFPDRPEMHEVYEKIAEHIYQFSMGGLLAIKESLEEK